MIIAIDGPAGSGKSTTARGVAAALGYLYLDTGAMYRAVALAVIRAGRPFDEEAVAGLIDETTVDLSHEGGALRVFLNGKDVSRMIRTAEVSAASSKVATLRSVREKMVREQRRIASVYERQGGGVVLEGRDIGTVVFPHADLKVFMSASEATRARRRFEELVEKGEEEAYASVVDEIRRRDRQDEERQYAPLRKAGDAIEIDTSTLSIQEQVDRVVALARERRGNSSV